MKTEIKTTELNQLEFAQLSISQILKQGGPYPEQYQLMYDLAQGAVRSNLVKEARQIVEPILNDQTLIGHSFIKPYGYSGDFEIIEKLYQEFTSEKESYTKWDIFIQQLNCSQAVRNRKDYFKTIFKEVMSKNSQAKILILACGPSTDVFEFLEEEGDAARHLTFDLVDLDKDAIAFAKNKTSKYAEQLSFINANVIRYRIEKEYDLIWSAGLFDYFSDKVFVSVLKRLIPALAENGEIVLGNFSLDNPEQDFMEVFGDWYLNYRSKENLIDIALDAGAIKGIKVDQEELGINLFLRIAG